MPQSNSEIIQKEETLTVAQINLDSNDADHLVAILKSVLGSIPWFGPMASEIVGLVFPNQRMDRIAEFLQNLEKRITSLPENTLKLLATNEHFKDLVFECVMQAAKSAKEERRKQILNIIMYGINNEEKEFQDSMYFLKFLSELNDIEIIWLKYYNYRSSKNESSFYIKFKEVLTPIKTRHDSTNSEFNQAALQKSYHEHLIRLGLLEVPITYNSLNTPSKPDITSIHATAVATTLGKLFLNYIDETKT